jgi:hypothetical protein
MEIPDWAPRPDSQQRRESAAAIAEAALASRNKIVPAHLREILSIAVWKYTECDGKYSTRYRSENSLHAPYTSVHHEHVIPRRQIVDALIADPSNAAAILERAIGCVVLREEHRSLGDVERKDPSLTGWDRYRAAGIAVWDLQERSRVV